MKSKNIPADIRSKSINEAQSEIKEIIDKLESPEANLKDSMDQYNRMMQLNYHIQDKFREKAHKIKQSVLDRQDKNLSKKKWNFMTNYSSKLNRIANSTNSYLKSFFKKEDINSYLTKPMKYGIFSGGKKFRSSIVVDTGKIYNIDYKKLIIIGSAIECIHSYSLIHDDLPSMDNDDLRRGKPSVHKKFNEFTAILAGNSLLTLAFQILSDRELKLSSNSKIELIKTLSKCAGHSGLAGGQYFDLTFEKKNILKKNIIDMQKKKTGQLFGFCCESIAIIKGASLKKRKELKDIGLSIGLLFQTVDDLIDYRGDSVIVGKPTRNDKKRGKATLVNLFGYENTISFAQNLKKKIDKKIKKYGSKANDLLESVEFILKREF